MALPPALPSKSAQRPIDEQITAAISTGFSTVLSDMRAQNAEIASALRDIAQAQSVMARKTKDARVAESGSTSVDAAHERMDRRESAANLSHRADAPAGMPQPRSTARSVEEMRDSTREGIRERVYNAVASRAENWTTHPLGKDVGGMQRRLKPGVTQDAKGRFHGPGGGFVKEEDAHEIISYAKGHHVDDAGRVRDAKGMFRRATQVSEDEAAAVTRRQVMARSVTDAAEAWKNGEPVGRALMHMLPEGAVKTIGGVAMGAEVAKQAWERTQEEYAKNRAMQRYYGGSNTAQFGERAAQFANSLSGRFSLLGSESYDELFQQAMKQGLRGDKRSDYINFGAGLMGKGVSGEQVGEIMHVSMSTTQSLRGLADAITSVNKVARDASVSAEAARNIFIENYKASSQVFRGQAGVATQLAQAYTTSQVAMGHGYMDVDFSGSYNLGQQYANAQTLGITPTDFSVLNQTTSGLPNLMAQDQRVKQILSTLTGTTGETVEQVVKRYINGLNRQYEPEADAGKVGLELEKAGFSQLQLQRILASVGIQASLAEAPGVVANFYSSYSPVQSYAHQQESQSAKYSGMTDRVKAGSIVKRTGSVAGGAADALDVRSSWGRAVDDIYTEDGPGGSQKWKRDVGKVELDLLQNVKTYGLGEKTMVQVMTKDGEKAVYFKEALKYFPDQINNGSAKILDGDQEGKTVSEVVGGLPKSITDKTAASTTQAAPDGIGTPLDTFLEDRRKESKEEGGTNSLVIDLKPRVAEIFDTFLNGKYTQNGQA